MIRIGLLGCGRIGVVHARGIQQTAGVRLVAVSDAFSESAHALAAQYHAKVRSNADIITAADIDAVIIGTPTDTHFDLIKGAAEAGKAIFCEKPIESSIQRIRDVKALVDQHNSIFMTGFNRRFDPNFQSVAQRIARGDIGNVELVTILSRDPAPPPIEYIQQSGGIFRDMMIHDFDMARFLLGEEPTSIHAVGSALVNPAIAEVGDVDTAAVTLTTATGKICQISNSRRANYGYDQRIEVHGSEGLLRADNVHENTVEFAGAGGFTRAPLQNFFLERYEIAYANEIAHFVDALNSGKSPTPSLQDGLQAQLMAEAAQKSFERKEVVVLEF